VKSCNALYQQQFWRRYHRHRTPRRMPALFSTYERPPGPARPAVDVWHRIGAAPKRRCCRRMATSDRIVRMALGLSTSRKGRRGPRRERPGLWPGVVARASEASTGVLFRESSVPLEPPHK
jgi:hypothetical protein